MANPFTTGPFNCCTCPEPPDYDPEVDDPLPTYVNLCGCPSVEVVCTSEEKTATLCGWEEADDGGSVVPSSPPKKYKTMSMVQSGVLTRTQVSLNCGTFTCGTLTAYGTAEFEYDEECSFSTVSASTYGGDYVFYECRESSFGAGDWSVVQSGSGTQDSSPAVMGSLPTATWFSQPGANIISTTEVEIPAYTAGSIGCSGFSTADDQRINTVTLPAESEDTEADALTRATSTEGTSCSSLYQLRTTSFTFTQRTSTYTATASNLVIGVQYEGCVRIRRREAYSGTVPSGADTAWYDVEPDTIAAFTATATEEEVATDVALPNVQGYEYEVVGAYVWPTSAGCDCPTSYVAP